MSLLFTEKNSSFSAGRMSTQEQLRFMQPTLNFFVFLLPWVVNRRRFLRIFRSGEGQRPNNTYFYRYRRDGDKK